VATVEKRYAGVLSPGNSPKKPTKKSRTIKVKSQTKRSAKAPPYVGPAQDLELEIRRLEAERELEAQRERSALAQIELLKLKMDIEGDGSGVEREKNLQ
jgi:hypothetical protein